MPVIKNILRKAVNSYQGLKDFNVLVEDTTQNSQYFNIFDIPEELPLGCSSFLIEGSDLLKKEVELKIELLDSENNVVFTTPVDNYLEDKSRRVSIEIYENIAPGVATLTILGELDPTKTNVPQSFRNVYNVRFTKRININKTKENDRPIRFYGQPTISVSEIVKGVVEETTGGTNQTSTVTGTVGLNVTTNKVFDSETDTELPTNNVDDLGEEEFILSESPKSKRTATFNSKIGKKGKKKKKQKKFKTTYSITGNVVAMGAGTNNSSNKITSDFVGATITISNPHQLVDTDKFPTTRYTLPTSYSTTISEVVNETTFKVKTPYYIIDDTTKRIPVSLKSVTNNASIKYDSYVEETESSIFKRSYADITIGNLRTFSGDVYKAKIFTRDSNTPTDFEKIYDAFVEPPNILIDQTSATGFTNIGFFHQQSDINNNWVSSSIGGSTGTLAVQNNQYLVDGILLSGSVEKLDSLVEFRTKNSFDLEKDVDYVVRFDSYFFKDTAEYKSDQDTISTESRADLKVFLSGSGLTGNTGEEDYYLGQVEIPKNSNDEGEISNVIGSFRSAGSGSPKAWLKFKLNSGRFIIKDASIEPFSEENFNPNYFRTIVPMPGLVNIKRSRLFDFRAEFYDVNNNEADVGATVERVNFDGTPTIIQGEDNKLSGSLLIGDSIEMYGTNPAYLRSVGYQGFAHTIANNKGGFLLFSGSIGDGASGGNRLTASEAYQGVGLEIVDAHTSTDRFLKFRTDPSTFQVVTDEFLLGTKGSTNNYISGSANGKLEISSSNFELNGATGDVTLQGTITAEAGGTVGGFTIGASSLAAGNVFQLSSSQNTADPVSFISSSNFKVSAGGDVTGSNILLTGGTITSDVTVQGTFTANQILTPADSTGIPEASASIDANGNAIFKSGSIGGFNMNTTTLFSDSNEFVVKGSSGQVTGSKVLFTGGKIGGFTIDADEIKSTNLLLDSNNEKITVGSANAVTIQGGGTDNFVTMGKTTFGQATTVGAILGMDATVPTLELFKDANNQFIFNGSGIDIKSATFDLDATTLIMDSATNSGVIKLGASGGPGSATGTSNGGAYIDGTGKFNFVGDANNFIRFNSSGLEINTAKFDVNTSGEITATGGTIGGFTISSTQLSGGSGDDFIGLIPGTGIQMGNETFADAEFSVTKAGALKSTSGTMGGFTIAAGTLTGGNVQLAAAGTIKVGSVTDATTTATTNAGFFADNSGNVLIKGNVNGDDYIKVTGGGGIDIKANDFDLNAGSGKLIIESSTPSISLTDATAKFIVGNLDSVTDTSDGDKGIYAQGDGKLLIKEDASNYIQFNGGLDIKTETFKLDTDRLDIDSSTSRISVFDDTGSPKEVIRIGEVDGASNFGMKIFDGTGTADGDILVEFSETTNNIAGWVIGTSTIQGGNLVLNKEGTIESADFSSGNIAGSGKGFRLSALDNGFLEVENARIRGTLSTAVFEKETVNAVGGQLLIGNSTTITGSAGLSGVTASSATMSVENVSGFTGSYNGFNAAGAVSNINNVDGEILLIKKVDNTGFSTEYVLVQSASFNDPDNTDTNSSGLLYVSRSFGLGTGTLGVGPGSNFTGSVGEGAKNYEDGQVIVSTGKYISGTGASTVGTGYINLNARPTDGATPYIDIVERTGSKVYEMDLKARLGDLSGISTAKVGSSPGFGLFTDRAFLTQDVTVGTLGAEHILISGSYLAFKDNNTIMAELQGTSWTLGGATGTTTDAIKIAPGGVFIYDNSNDYVKVTSAGLNVYESGNNVATFGANSTITGGTITIQGTAGSTGDEKLVIANNSITIDSAGNEIFSIVGGTMKLGTDANNGAFAQLDGSTLDFITDSSGTNTTRASFGANSTITGGSITLQGTTGTTGDEKVVIENNSISMFTEGNEVFDVTGAVMTIGSSTDKVTINGTSGITIRENDSDTIQMVNGVVTVGSSTDQVKIDGTSGITIRENDADTISMVNGVVTIGSSTDQVEINGTSGITIRENNKDNITLTDGTIKVGVDENNSTFIQIDSDSVDIIEDVSGTNNTVASFGVSTTIGSSTDKVSISASGLTLRENNVDTLTIASGVVTVGSSTDKVTINGTSGITIRENDSDTISMVNGVVTIGSSTDQVEINGTSGITIRENNKDNITLTDGTIKVGVDENNSTFVKIDSDSVDIIEDVSGTDNTVASFGVSTTIGSSTDKVSISASGITIRENNKDVITMASDVVTVGSSTDKVTINGTSGITIRENGADTISMINGVVTIGSSTDQVEINGTSGITIRENNKDNISLTDGTIKVGVDENDSTFIQIDSDSVDIIEDVGGANKTVASFGVSTTIGSSTDKVSISDSGITIRENNKDVISLASDVVTIGSATDKVTINGTSGITIKENNVDTISMVNGVVTIGSSTDQVEINGTSGITIRENNVDTIILDDGAVTVVGGTFTINDGTRNRLVIGSTSIAMTDEAGNEQVKIEDASGTPTLTLGEVAANQENIVIDPTNGVRLRTNTTTHAQLAGTEFVMGEVASSKSNVQITAGTVNFRNNTDVLFAITDDGQISGSDFMIEKTRLFGNGNDGIITLEHDNCAVSDGVGSAAKSSTSLIVNERGENLCERTGTTWFLKGDMYAKDLTLNNDGTAVTLNTSGSRLFVKSTLTIDSSCIIHNDGNAGGNGGNGGNDGDVAGTRGSAGHGGAGNSLAPGTTGAQGGLGGTSSSTPNGRPGGGGGGAGGTGGHVFIAARVINNSGTIRSHGGAGGNGGTGGSV